MGRGSNLRGHGQFVAGRGLWCGWARPWCSKITISANFASFSFRVIDLPTLLRTKPLIESLSKWLKCGIHDNPSCMGVGKVSNVESWPGTLAGAAMPRMPKWPNVTNRQTNRGTNGPTKKGPIESCSIQLRAMLGWNGKGTRTMAFEELYLNLLCSKPAHLSFVPKRQFYLRFMGRVLWWRNEWTQCGKQNFEQKQRILVKACNCVWVGRDSGAGGG